MKLPTIAAISELVRALKPTIGDEYRAYDGPDSSDDTTPSMLLTVGADSDGNWSYQTGDNSYSGGAYHYPYWGVATIDRRCNSREVARQIIDEIADAQSY